MTDHPLEIGAWYRKDAEPSARHGDPEVRRVYKVDGRTVLWAAPCTDMMLGKSNLASFVKGYPVKVEPAQPPLPRAHVLTVGGVSIWHTYKHPWAELFWYSTNAHRLIAAEREEMIGDMRHHFNVRALPARCLEGLAIEGLHKNSDGELRFDGPSAARLMRHAHIAAIARALTYGDLDDHLQRTGDGS